MDMSKSRLLAAGETSFAEAEELVCCFLLESVWVQ